MSRREGRDSESKRSSYSRIEREPSPKRSRRDGKPKTERNTSRNDVDTIHSNHQDQKLRRRLQDALPLEAPIEPESKVEPDNVKAELKKADEKENSGTRHSSDPTEVPRSRTYFQHDERGIAGQGGRRSFSRRAATDRGWTDTKDRSGDKSGGDEMDVKKLHKREERSERPGGVETDVKNLGKKDERTNARADDNNVWRHDRFHDLEADAPAPARKRPAFREKKVEQGSGNTTRITEPEPGRPSRLEQPVSENARRDEWGGRRPYDDRLEKPLTRDRAPQHRRESQRVGFSPRERFGGGGGGGFMGRDRFSGRYGERNQNYNVRTEKWKHDLFDEANKSPSPKHAEDPIAKVEALLAS